MRTNEEAEIVSAMNGQVMIGRFKNDMMQKLVEVIGNWLWYIGLGKTTDDKDIATMSVFIKKFYPTLTLPEINLAVELSVTGSLTIDGKRVDPNTYDKGFTPLYVSRILEGYIQYKNNVMRELIDRKNTDMKSLPAPDVTLKEKRDLTIELLKG